MLDKILINMLRLHKKRDIICTIIFLLDTAQLGYISLLYIL